MHVAREEVALLFGAGLIALSSGCARPAPPAIVALPTATTSAVVAPPPLRGDVCQVPASDMCLEFDRHDRKNEPICTDFESGSFEPDGRCAHELRLGSCRVGAEAMSALYYAGDNNDVIDSKEHCEETLHGVFTPTPRAEIVATWRRLPLGDTFTGFSMLMPAGPTIELHGASVSVERSSGYFGVILTREPLSISDAKTEAEAGSEWFKFGAWTIQEPTKLVWTVHATKGGDLGYKFVVEVAVGRERITCESLTVFDDVELMNANIAACQSLARP